MNIIVYYRVRPSEPECSHVALQEQRLSVKAWLENNGAILQGEFIEPETDGFDRPQLSKAVVACKKLDATLLIARTEPIGRSGPFVPRISSVPSTIVPSLRREHGHIIPAPMKSPLGLSLYFLASSNLNTSDIYLCNNADESLQNVSVRTIGITSKLTTVVQSGADIEDCLTTTPSEFSLGELGGRGAVLISHYDAPFDSDLIVAFEIVGFDQDNQRHRFTAFVGPGDLPTFVRLTAREYSVEPNCC